MATREEEKRFIEDFIYLIQRHNLSVPKMAECISAVIHGEEQKMENDISIKQSLATQQKKLKAEMNNPKCSAADRWMMRHSYDFSNRIQTEKISKWGKVRFLLSAGLWGITFLVRVIFAIILRPAKKK